MVGQDGELMVSNGFKSFQITIEETLTMNKIWKSRNREVNRVLMKCDVTNQLLVLINGCVQLRLKLYTEFLKEMISRKNGPPTIQNQTIYRDILTQLGRYNQ